MRRIALLVWVASLAACNTLRPTACATGQQAAVQDLVYFGTQTPTGEVAPDAWKGFLADTVTPRFPQGFSTWPASGQWRSDTGGIVHEPSYVLSLVHPASGSDDDAVRAIVATYKARFRQEAVLQVRSAVCMAL